VNATPNYSHLGCKGFLKLKREIITYISLTKFHFSVGYTSQTFGKSLINHEKNGVASNGASKGSPTLEIHHVVRSRMGPSNQKDSDPIEQSKKEFWLLLREHDDTVLKCDGVLAAQCRSEIRLLSQSVIMAQENERMRIASDLHDGLAQNLAMLKFNVEASIDKLQSDHTDLDLTMLENVANQVKAAVEEVRRISRNLTPTTLDDLGLQHSIEGLCREIELHHPDLQIDCSLCADEQNQGENEIPNLIVIALFRIVQEGLNNAIKHAQASLIKVAIEWTDDGIELNLLDNGVGFTREYQTVWGGEGTGLGFRSMRERVSATGGSLEIESGQDQGTSIRATWSEQDLKSLAE
jgi:signal transduction histidine kinase